MVTETSKSWDNLIAGDFPRKTIAVTIASGDGEQPRGALLGKITSSGKYILSLSAAGDGSEAPIAVLAEDVDATAADVETVAYISGEFNGAAMTFGTGHDADSVSNTFIEDGRPIYIRDAEPA